MGKYENIEDSIKNIEVQTDLYNVDLFFIFLIAAIGGFIINTLFTLTELGSYFLKVKKISKPMM